ncbi:hypothetical protein G7Z17_g5199 [Cylindrodendrum hubeiense]|uniref:RNA-dependent RNA polymerase n=1 Tax=Cylindrodendrum hubeiense TaxID=595255 RepID=A0A9P5LBY2_9HYPO|nr:hypothetical protein G7Z17_g5199 [Cylindrodendrum hubeiense]
MPNSEKLHAAARGKDGRRAVMAGPLGFHQESLCVSVGRRLGGWDISPTITTPCLASTRLASTSRRHWYESSACLAMAATLPVSTRQEELHRTIRSLSLDFELHLQVPNPTISPSKRRQQHRTSEQERVDAIYNRAHYLHFKDPRQLSTSIGRFREQADRLLRDWTSKRNANPDAAPTSTPLDPLRARPSLEERAVLQRLLLELLQNANSSPTRAKRPSPEFPGRDPKRPKPQPIQVADSLDDIPVRSRTSIGTSTTLSTPSRASSFMNRSASSSKLSFASSVFSTVDGGVFSSQTTIESARSRNVIQGSSFTSKQTIDDSFGHYDTRPPDPETPQPARHLPRDGKIREEENILAHSGRSIVPHMAFPVPGLNQAPFIILWELTRAAIHCNVDLAQWDLEYKPNDAWHNQTKFRGKVVSHPLFVGKGLPPPCDANSWAAGLGNFNANGKTLTLSVDLAYSAEESGPLFRPKLHPPKLELGHRLSRRFGADRFMEVTLPSPYGKDTPSIIKKDIEGPEKIIQWLTDKLHYFVGRSWAPFYTRDVKKTIKDPQPPHKTRNIYQERVQFFAVDGISFRLPQSQFPPPQEASCLSARTKMKRSDLLGWALNIENNTNQPVPKLFSRLALSLSRTFPTIVLERHQIQNRDVDLGSKDVMNDGIGRMSRSVARKVATHLGISETPCCYQARIGSAKGIWIVDVEDDGLDDNDWIETYPSQRKWKCDFEDIHHRTFEVRNWARELRSAALNAQFIPVLEAQSQIPGMMRKAIAKHLEDGLRMELDGQIAAMNHPMDLRAWIRRSAFSSISGLSQGHVPFTAGLPDREEDIIPFLLDAGFDTKVNQFLKELTWDMRKRQTDQLKEKMNIKIPRSTYAYMVVDFTGTLEEGEVQLAFSSKFEADGESDTLLDGIEVLVARAPAHFVSDIQKVKAVFKPNLKQLKDVIVFSSKGDSPLADLLSGGDYDGDQAWVCWDPEIVRNFTNSPVPDQPKLVDLGYIQTFNPTFQSILDTSVDMESACATFLHSAISFSMQPSLLGICTSFKERLCYYENSVSSQRAVALSTLVGLLVDQSKQGLLFSNDDYNRLKNDMNMKGREPEYLNERSSNYVNRDRSIHILDYLKFDIANVVIEKSLESFYKTINTLSVTKWDDDLIKAVESKWKVTMTNRPDASSNFNAKVKEVFEEWVSIQPPKELLSSRSVVGLLDVWNGDPALSKWALLKASTTFKMCHGTGYKMVWRLAGQQLAHIKAMASRKGADVSSVAVTAEMWNVLRPDTKRITALAARRESGQDNESLAAIEEISEFDDNGTQLDDS